jgi:hypothetical protein
MNKLYVETVVGDGKHLFCSMYLRSFKLMHYWTVIYGKNTICTCEKIVCMVVMLK